LCCQLVAVVTIIFRSSLVGVCGGVEDKVTEGWVGLRGWWHCWLCCQLVAVIILVTPHACTSQACISLTGAHLPGVRLTGVRLTGVHCGAKDVGAIKFVDHR
jgi:hypothetical protein